MAGKRERSTLCSSTCSMLRGWKSFRASSPAPGEGVGAAAGGGAGAVEGVRAWTGSARARANGRRAPALPAAIRPSHSRRLTRMIAPGAERLTRMPAEDTVNLARERQRLVERAEPHVPPEHHSRRARLHVRRHLAQDGRVIVLLHASGEE